MKKFLLSLVALLVGAFALTSCGYDKTVLSADADGKTFHAAGGWGEWACNDNNKMTATSVKEVSQYSKELADTLATKNLKYLYVAEIEVGTKDAGWTAKALKENEVYVFNGVYTVKCIRGTYDAEDGVYANDQWISDPKTAHVEALTNNIFIPTWTEAKDDNGFSWGDNPVITSGAGVYYMVVAQYTDVSTAEVAGFGFGFVLKETKTEAEGIAAVKYVAPAVKSYGVIGSFNSWGADVAMTSADNGATYTAEVTLSATDVAAVDNGVTGAQLKVRVNAGWDESYGADANGANLVVTTAGTYIVTYTVATGLVTIAAKAA